MAWELSLIRALQKLSGGFMDFVNLAFTYAGDEIFFIIVAVVLFWCVDKKFAYKFMNVYILSVASNEGLKALFRRPRPYTAEGIRSIGEKTSGYSFPSGHSQSIANIAAQVNGKYKSEAQRRVFLPLGIGLCIVVMFTRMYLGQHFLTDVLTGAVLGVALAIVFGLLFDLLKDREEWIVLGVAPLCTVVLIVLLATGAQGAGNVMNVLGAYTAICAGYFLEKRYVKYDVRSDRWWKYIVKVALGLAITLALKEGLKFLFPETLPFLYNYLRYFLMGIWGSLGSMALFKLCKL